MFHEKLVAIVKQKVIEKKQQPINLKVEEVNALPELFPNISSQILHIFFILWRQYSVLFDNMYFFSEYKRQRKSCEK